MAGQRASPGEQAKTAPRDGVAAKTKPGAATEPDDGSIEAGHGSSALPLFLALATLVIAYWCVDIAPPALPDLQQSLNLSGTGAGLVFACFFGGRLIGNFPAALIAGRLGPRATAAAGAGALLFGSLLAARAEGAAALLPARGLQGAGIAFLVTAGLLLLLRHRPGGGAAMTAFNVAAGAGSSAGLAAGGSLTGAFGWRSVFWLSAALAAILFSGAIAARLDSASGQTRGRKRPDETATRLPRRQLAAALFANLLVYANYSIWIVSLGLYASDRFRVGPAGLGSLLLVVNFVHLVAALPAGGAIRHYGAARILVAGLAVSAVGMALIPTAPSIGWLLPPMACYAVGQVAGNSAAGDLLLRLGGGGGRAVGMVRVTSDVGVVVGPAAVGLLADAAGVGAPFAALTVVTVAGAAISWRVLVHPTG